MNEEEIKNLRNYLATQSMRRTPAQLIEALQEAYHQFTITVAVLPDTAYYTLSDEHAWSAFEIIEHVCLFMSSYKASICCVLEKGQRPSDVHDRQEIIPHRNRAGTQDELLFTLEEVFRHLTRSVHQADQFIHLDITWNHFELGAMHWREWLLFARVHLLDHVHQVKQIQGDFAE